MTDPESATPGERAAPAQEAPAMTRSEEELLVHRTVRPAERLRIRKHLVTEDVTVTVRVQHEELTIEREPITGSELNLAKDLGGELGGSELEVILRREEFEIVKRVVPSERVRVQTYAVTEELPVSEQLRKERIDLDHDAVDRPGPA